MTPNDAMARLQSRLSAAGWTIDGLTATDGFRLMLEFYRDVRAVGCDLEADGDMLLAEWGVSTFGRGPAYQFTITRQFIVADGEDDVISQLQLTFRYPVGEGAATGNRWCATPDDVDTFAGVIAPVLDALPAACLSVDLVYDMV